MKKIYFLPIFIFFNCGNDNVFDSKIEELDFYNKVNEDLKNVKQNLEKENRRLENDIDTMDL